MEDPMCWLSRIFSNIKKWKARKVILKDGLRAGKDSHLNWVWFHLTYDGDGKLAAFEEKQACAEDEKLCLNAFASIGRIVCRSYKIGAGGARCVLASEK